MKRETKYELLRIISMLFIIGHHFIAHNGNINVIAGNNFIYSLLYCGGKFGVAIFIMITGYFMIDKKTNYKRLINLELQVLIYSIGIYLLFILTGIYPITKEELLMVIFPNFKKCIGFFQAIFSSICYLHI